VNTRLHIPLGALAIAVSLPWAGPLSSSALEREIGQQMNRDARPQVTRSVDCARKARSGDNVRYACVLHGARAGTPPLRVRVDVNGSDWRAFWPPVEG
jgi:hypothetical protein